MSKRSCLSLLLFLGMLVPARVFSQQQPGRGRGPAVAMIEQINTALTDLKLTDEQKAKIKTILDTARTDARGLQQQMQQADQPTRRGMTRQFSTTLHDKIVAVLTPEQAQAFEQKFQAAQPVPVGQAIERLYDFLGKVDLDDAQKKQVDDLFAQTRQNIAKLRANPPGDGSMPGRIQDMVQILRGQLATILTEAQQQKLREAISTGDAGAPGVGRGMQQMMQSDAQANATAVKPPEHATPDLMEITGVAVDQPAPDFSLNNLEGRSIQLANYKNKLLLVVFANYSSPAFRQRASALEQLRREYSSRINVLLIYTRENYPTGQWEVDRNKEEGISVEQPTDMAGRVKLAKQTRDSLKLTMPVAVDTMDDSIAKAYGGFTNAAVLVGRDGTVLAKQKWFEPYALKPHIDDAVKQGQK